LRHGNARACDPVHLRAQPRSESIQLASLDRTDGRTQRSRVGPTLCLSINQNYMPAHVNDFAKVLLFMMEKGMLNHRHFKRTVGALVRDSMETDLPHCTTSYRSRRAQEVIVSLAPRSRSQYHGHCSVLRHEHMVPTKVRLEILARLQEQDPTEELIVKSLRSFGLRATLHADEDRQLDQAGLRWKMPPSFWDEGGPMHMNPLARYIETGLIRELVPRSGACWFADDRAAGLYP
jgi:hypothetical protein